MKYIYISIFFILNLFISNNVIADQSVIKELQKGGKIVFIRHSLAPGNGDPENLNLDDCKTQRNLSTEGIIQSKKIGNFFKKNNIKIGKVLSSEWCRCKDTSFYAFTKYSTFNGLNSFYDPKFYKNKQKQIKSLKKFVKNWDGKSNLILVTHYVVILEILNLGASSGEVIVTNKDYKTLGRIKID